MIEGSWFRIKFLQQDGILHIASPLHVIASLLPMGGRRNDDVAIS